jgi:hypothetical protein
VDAYLLTHPKVTEGAPIVARRHIAEALSYRRMKGLPERDMRRA